MVTWNSSAMRVSLGTANRHMHTHAQRGAPVTDVNGESSLLWGSHVYNAALQIRGLGWEENPVLSSCIFVLQYVEGEAVSSVYHLGNERTAYAGVSGRH